MARKPDSYWTRSGVMQRGQLAALLTARPYAVSNDTGRVHQPDEEYRLGGELLEAARLFTSARSQTDRLGAGVRVRHLLEALEASRSD